MGRILAALALILALAGCAGTETATVGTTEETTATTTSPAAAMDAFRDELKPVLNDLGNGMRWMGGAAQSLDMADLRAACRSFDGNVDQLDALLPSPDSQITQRLRGAVTNFREMAGICQGASLRMGDSDFDEMGRLRDAGYAELTAAVDLIKQAP